MELVGGACYFVDNPTYYVGATCPHCGKTFNMIAATVANYKSVELTSATGEKVKVNVLFCPECVLLDESELSTSLQSKMDAKSIVLEEMAIPTPEET